MGYVAVRRRGSRGLPGEGRGLRREGRGLRREGRGLRREEQSASWGEGVLWEGQRDM